MAVNQGSAPRGGGKPQSVQGTTALLALQGAIWGLVCMVTFSGRRQAWRGSTGPGRRPLPCSPTPCWLGSRAARSTLPGR